MALYPLHFPGKIRLLFALFGLFLRSQVKGSFHSHDSRSTSSKKILVPTLSSFAALGQKGYFNHILEKNELEKLMQNLMLN